MTVAANLTISTMSVDAGDSVSCDVQVHNTSDVVDQLAVDIVGDAAGWGFAQPGTINLMPGTSGTVTLTFAPPRSSAVLAGIVPFGVRVRSRENPASSVVEEGMVEVLPFTEVSSYLVPPSRHARRKARFRLAVENTGNHQAPVVVRPLDEDPDALQVRAEPAVLTAAPGTVSVITVTAAARRRFMRGQPKTFPFNVEVAEASEMDGWPIGEPSTISGTLVQERTLPKWLLPALGVLAAAVVALLAMWFAVVAPAVKTIATEQVAPQAQQASQAAQQANSAAAKADVAAQAATGGTAGGAKPGGAGQGSSSDSKAPSASQAPPTPTGPIEFRIATQAKPVTDGSYQRFSYTAPGGQPLALGDMVLQNPRGDSGFLRVVLGDQVVLESGLANFRDLDYHYVNQLHVAKGQQVIIEVNCTAPGSGSPVCTPSVSFSGTVGG